VRGCPRRAKAAADAQGQSQAAGGPYQRQGQAVAAQMICDTTLLSDLAREQIDGRPRGAAAFLRAHRNQPFLVSVISIGEVAVIFEDFNHARIFLAHYRQLRLTPEIAFAAAAVDQELIGRPRLRCSVFTQFDNRSPRSARPISCAALSRISIIPASE